MYLNQDNYIVLEERVEGGIVYETELSELTHNYRLLIEKETGDIYLVIEIGDNIVLSGYDPRYIGTLQ